MTDSELQSFIKFCRSILTQPDGAFAVCKSASEARRLRRRFYHLKEQLTGEDAIVAASLTTKVTGRLFHVMKAPPPSQVDWETIATGERNEQITLSTSDRLDDEGDIR
jgi:hypothetical protein